MPRRPVPSHRPLQGTVPPREVFEVFIEKTDTHWYWEEDFVNFDGDRYAVLRKRFDGRTNIFVVVRALWCQEHPDADLTGVKQRLFNACGVVACVNPGHLEYDAPPSKSTKLAADAKLHDGTPVRLHPAGLVHIVPTDVTSTMCGVRVLHNTHAPRAYDVTCPECVTMWLAQGYTFDEAS